MFVRKTLPWLSIAAMMLTAAPAQAQDVAKTLIGRWASAATDWTPMGSDRAQYLCSKDLHGVDRSLTFSGSAGALIATSGRNGYEEDPLVQSPVTLGASLSWGQSTGYMKDASAITEISYKFRGRLGTEPLLTGHVGIFSPDRIIIYDTKNGSVSHLVRCAS